MCAKTEVEDDKVQAREYGGMEGVLVVDEEMA